MMKKSMSVLGAAFLAATLLAPAAWSADKKAKKKSAPAQTDPAQAAMMAKWQEFATPNENHKRLERLVGTWDHTIEWWMSGDAPAEVSTGTSVNAWVLGGRYIRQTVTGTTMGQPFEGLGITGYDNARKEYVSVWLDNMGTGIMTGAGRYDAASDSMTDNSTFSDPMTGGPKTSRGVTTFQGADQHTYEMHCAGPDGKEFRAMRIVYKRRK